MQKGSELRFSETGSVLFNFFGVKFELRNGNQKHNLKYDKLWRLRTKMKVSKTHWRFWMPNMALPNILIQKSRRNSGFENFISHFRFWTWILAPRSRFWEMKLRSMLLNDRVTEIPPEIHSILINNGRFPGLVLSLQNIRSDSPIFRQVNGFCKRISKQVEFLF